MPNETRIQEKLQRESAPLFTRRLRAILWIIVFTILAYSVVDFYVYPTLLLTLWGLKLAALTVIASTLIQMRRPRSLEWLVVATLVCVFVGYTTSAVLGTVTADGTTLFATALATLVLGMMFPWGPWAQSAVVTITAFAVVINIYGVEGSLSATNPMLLMLVAVTWLISIYVGYELEQNRWAVALESAERMRVEEDLQDEAQVSAALARVGQELLASVDQPTLLHRLCEVSNEVLDCDSSLTWLWQASEDAYVPVAAHGYAGEEWETIRLIKVPPTIVAELLARLARDEVVQVREETAGNLLPTALLRFRMRPSTVLLVALRRAGELVGAHACIRERARAFMPSHERIGRGIAHLASIALEHARTREELERANNVKDHFVATLSHELRNPIAAIFGYQSILLEEMAGPLNAEQADLLRGAQKCAEDLNRLIITTLDLSRFETKRVPLDLQEVKVPELIDELAREVRTPADKAGVSLIWKVESDVAPLRTDPFKLKMILVNLVGNAVKFTEAGHVTVDAAGHNGHVEFRVSDSGIGIPAEALPSIFEPFEQAHGVISHRKGGAGLGLYIVQRLVTILGATITVDSEVGRGSTFCVSMRSMHGDASA